MFRSEDPSETDKAESKLSTIPIPTRRFSWLRPGLHFDILIFFSWLVRGSSMPSKRILTLTITKKNTGDNRICTVKDQAEQTDTG